MAVNRGGGTLAGARGADLLAALADKMVPAREQSRRECDTTAEEDLLLALSRNPPLPPGARPIFDRLETKPGKEILRIADPDLRRQVRAAVRAATPSTAAPAAAKIPVDDMGEAAFRRITAMRDRLESFNASHLAPASVRDGVRTIIARRMALGADKVCETVDRDDGYFIGYDFGTSTTKAVLRHPYRPSAAAFAIPVPAEWASGAQPHLWPTALWYDPVTERFSAVPEQGWACLQGFKSALIEGRGHRTCCGTPVLMREAAAAFLAVNLAYVIGAALEMDAGLRIAGINIGAPVEALSGPNGKASFDNVARTALSLVPFATSLTKADVRTMFSCESEPVLPFQLHTELTGAIAGYCTAPRHYFGGHMIIDCGSATLDLASFKLGSGTWPIDIYSARVEPLGADACLNYQRYDATAEDCRNAARFLEHAVYRDTVKRERLRFEQDRGKFPYQVILIGGGVHGTLHKPLLDGMEAAFHRPFHRPRLAPDLLCDPAIDPGRLVLADGLARDPIDLRKVAMPLDSAPAPSHCQPEMITKDQV